MRVKFIWYETKATVKLFKLNLGKRQITNKINNQIIYIKKLEKIWLLDILPTWYKIYSKNKNNSEFFCFQSISYIFSQILYA